MKHRRHLHLSAVVVPMLAITAILTACSSAPSAITTHGKVEVTVAPLDAQTWDYVMRGPISEWRVIRYMALLRIIRDDILKEGRAAGLRPRIVAQRSQYAFGRC